MSVWFDGYNDIECGVQRVKQSLNNNGEHYVGVISRMPGLSKVELVDQGIDFVTIKTNEGLMNRTNIIKHIENDRVTMELDEVYQAGAMVTTRSHFFDEFTPSEVGVRHRTIISDVKTSGVLGILYRIFGKSNTGNAFLQAYKTYLESQTDLSS